MSMALVPAARADPFLTGVRAGLQEAAARGVAAAARSHPKAGLTGARVLLKFGLDDFARDIVLSMARRPGGAAAAGAIHLSALDGPAGDAETLRRFAAALLRAGHVDEAAAVGAACWEAALAAGVPPAAAARSLAGAAVEAVDAGCAAAVAAVQARFAAAGLHHLAMWVTVAVAREEGRPDAAARATLAAMRQDGGAALAAACAALAMVEGHFLPVAAISAAMHALAADGAERAAVAAVVADASAQACAAGRPGAAAAVGELLLRKEALAPHGADLMAASVDAMRREGRGDVVGEVAVAAARAGGPVPALLLARALAARGELAALALVARRGALEAARQAWCGGAAWA
jgi:hypothetical protein